MHTIIRPLFYDLGKIYLFAVWQTRDNKLRESVGWTVFSKSSITINGMADGKQFTKKLILGGPVDVGKAINNYRFINKSL